MYAMVRRLAVDFARPPEFWWLIQKCALCAEPSDKGFAIDCMRQNIKFSFSANDQSHLRIRSCPVVCFFPSHPSRPRGQSDFIQAPILNPKAPQKDLRGSFQDPPAEHTSGVPPSCPVPSELPLLGLVS